MAPKQFVFVIHGEDGPTEVYKTEKAAKEAAGDNEVIKLELKDAVSKASVKKPAKRATPVEDKEDEDQNEEAEKPAKKKAKKPSKDAGKSLPEGVPGSFDGLSMLFTGTMEMSRPAMEAGAKRLGASITKKLADTDYIILGTNPGGNKVTEIEEKGLRTITEAEFLEFMETGEAPA